MGEEGGEKSFLKEVEEAFLEEEEEEDDVGQQCGWGEVFS
jgi:hypothetical protein